MPPTPDHTDAYLALAGALGGVTLAGLFAYLQHRMLRAAEGERLTKQLDHDRAMDDRAYLRRAIEDWLDRFDESITDLINYKIAVDQRDAEGDRDDRRLVAEAHGKAVATYSAVLASERRLALWLPAKSRVARGWMRQWKGLREAHEALKGPGPLHTDADGAFEKGLSNASAGLLTFSDAVRAEAGVSV